jgi:hypothetical protein
LGRRPLLEAHVDRSRSSAATAARSSLTKRGSAGSVSSKTPSSVGRELSAPSFIAIRFFTEPDGWVGHFTGTDIAKRFPRYEGGQAG